MSSRNLTDLYLPPKITYHVKILVAAVLITGFFNLVWSGRFLTEPFLITLAFVVVQLELFLIIALKLFPGRLEKFTPSYKRSIIIRLSLFYLIILIIGVAFFLLAVAIPMLVGEAKYSDMVEHFVAHDLKRFLISWLIAISIASVAFFYMEWNNALKRERKLREDKLIFQYESLKSKVNPHFLFNSLNTLSSLIPKDPELSERFIAKFSTIYRYVLEKADSDMVGLEEEIDFIQNFFFLQKIRDNGKINLEIDVKDKQCFMIVPVSLQLLVENALKHNAATKESPLNIKIYLEKDESVVVENNIQKKMNLEPSSKVGLKNLKERISLVMRKPLFIEDGPLKFVVKLPVLKKTHENFDHRR
jgi:sensor histidine kinase YesM